MNTILLEPGLYVNVFRVNLPDKRVSLMLAPSKNFASLQELRTEIEQLEWTIHVYRYRDQIFGYGRDMKRLASKGFQQQQVRLLEHPQWCVRLINEGISNHLKTQGYRKRYGKGRTTLYEPKPYRTAVAGRLKIFRGYDLRTIYIWQGNLPILGLIVDICWEIQNEHGQCLDTREIQRYNAMAEIAQIQDEFFPDNRINPEVCRLRLHNHILPFVQANKEFSLPLAESIKASLEETPLRVILGVVP